MLQFYFLSILLNLTAGLIFVYVSKNDSTSLALSEPDDFGLNPDSDDFSDTENSAPKSEKSSATGLGALAAPFLGDKTLQLVVGILSVLTGIMKLLSPIQFDVPLVGDLLPSLGGIHSWPACQDRCVFSSIRAFHYKNAVISTFRNKKICSGSVRKYLPQSSFI